MYQWWQSSVLWYGKLPLDYKELTHYGLVMLYGDWSGSTLAQIMACCLMAPSHYLNQCWLLISEVLWHLPESNSTVRAPATTLYDEFENYTFQIAATSPRRQWVNSLSIKCQWKNSLLAASAILYSRMLRADSRFGPSQWEMSLLCHHVSH